VPPQFPRLLDAVDGELEEENVCEPNLIQLIEISDNRVIIPKVRNIQQSNHETEKCVYVNPNKFESVEKSF
jgi:hypothetical protein